MASPPSPWSPATKRPRLASPAANTQDSDPLPTDELQEVLLRLPSKPLCQLRGVCQAWRSMLSDQLFVAAHASRCRADSLLVVAVYNAADLERVNVNLVDVSTGTVVRRLDGLRRGYQHLCAGGGLLCFVGTKDRGVHVLNPATGATADFPGVTTANGHHNSYTFAEVPATGEHKVLHIYDHTGGMGEQSCAVFTIGGGHSHGQHWKPTQSPPARVESSISRRSAVVHGVVYFLSSHQKDSIAVFDLETEQWRSTLLRGPLSSSLPGCQVYLSHLSLAELNGRLVTVHHNYRDNTMDVWSLTDLEKETWSRTHSLRLDSVLQGREGKYEPMMVQVVRRDRESVAQPLMVLEDGRIALWVGGMKGVVRLYDARTETSKEVVDMGKYSVVVGFYKGSLLGFGAAN